MFFKIIINNSLENRRPKSNFVIFYCMHCKKKENFYNTYNLKLFFNKKLYMYKTKNPRWRLMCNPQKTLYVPNHAYTKTFKYIKTVYTNFHI